MKTRILSIALILASTASYAQIKVVERQYKNNGFSVAQQEKQMSRNSTGKIFYTRLQSFDSFSKKSLKPYMSRQSFIAYLDQFKGLMDVANMNGYSAHVKAIKVMYDNIKGLSKISTNDDHRYSLYEITAPVYKAVDESWGNDVVDAVIKEAYLNLYDYVNAKVNSGERDFANAKAYINMEPIKTDESKGQCQYTVSIDKPVLQKDDIEVYFCDMALFRKISKKYDGALLEGPISGWQAYKDESATVRAMLQAYEGKKEIPAYYVYMYKLKDYGNPATVQQNLHKDMNWFVWVFRNGMLYYSYMAIPCADLNRTTVYEERLNPALEDPGMGGNDFQY